MKVATIPELMREWESPRNVLESAIHEACVHKVGGYTRDDMLFDVDDVRKAMKQHCKTQIGLLKAAYETKSQVWMIRMKRIDGGKKQ